MLQGGEQTGPQQVPLEPGTLQLLGRQRLEAQALGSHLCLHTDGEGCGPSSPSRGRRPQWVQCLAGSGASVELSLGPTGPRCQTWWSPAFCDLRLPHADLAPHLASIWGWHSEGGGHIWLGKSEDPQGAGDPRGRVSEPLKRHATCCRLGCVPLPGAGDSAGAAGPSQPSPPAASRPLLTALRGTAPRVPLYHLPTPRP